MPLWKSKYDALNATLEGLKQMRTYQVNLEGVNVEDMIQKVTAEMYRLEKTYATVDSN